MAERKRRRSSSTGLVADGGGSTVPEAFTTVIGYHLRVAQEASFQAIRQGAGKSDLKPGWYTILTLLSDNPGLTPTELSRLCGRDRSTLTSTLKGLSARGFISRRHTPEDQRSYSVHLTAAGEAMLRKLRVIARAHDARLDAIVGKDKPLLLAILRRIAETLARPDDAARREPRQGGRRRSGGRTARSKAVAAA